VKKLPVAISAPLTNVELRALERMATGGLSWTCPSENAETLRIEAEARQSVLDKGYAAKPKKKPKGEPFPTPEGLAALLDNTSIEQLMGSP